MSNAEFGLLFKSVGIMLGQGPNMHKLHVFDEPHKRYNSTTIVSERHKHLIFKMKAPFAHVRFQKEMAARGVYNHSSFNLVGHTAYLQ